MTFRESRVWFKYRKLKALYISKPNSQLHKPIETLKSELEIRPWKLTGIGVIQNLEKISADFERNYQDKMSRV